VATTADWLPVTALISKPYATSDDNDTSFVVVRGCCASANRVTQLDAASATPRVAPVEANRVAISVSVVQFCGNGAMPSSLAKAATLAL
jgi:hypothetical protein